MSREIMIIAKNKDGVISNNIVKIGENGQPIVIKGTKDTFYEIKDMATNRAPDQIYTKRFKNDLKLKINPKGGALDGAGEADVVIQDYCANGNCEIVGVHETGEYYQYVPQSGDADLMTTKMADGEFAYQSLGTVESSSWGPASLLPLAGLGGLGGGGGSKPDTTPPDAPNLTMVMDDYDADDTSNWKYGATNDTATWGIDSDGKVTLLDGGVFLTAEGKISTNDTTPTFIISEKEAGSTIEVYDHVFDSATGTYVDILIESTMVDNGDGTWSVTVNEETASGDSNVLSDGEHTLILTQTDATGNVLNLSEGTQINLIVDTTSPIYVNKFNITDIDQGDGVRNSRDYYSSSAGDNYYFTNEFTVSDDLGYTYGAQGSSYAVFNSIPYEVGDRIYIEIYLLDEFGEISETYRIIDQNLSVEASAIVDSDGKWSVDVNSATAYNVTSGEYGVLPDGEYAWRTLVVEPSGNFSAQSTTAGGYFAIDTTAPEANSIESFARDGDDIVLRGSISGYASLSVAAGGESGDGVYNRDDDFLIGTTASKLYISRSDDDGVSYYNVGEVNIGQTGSEWNFTDKTITEDGVYIYKVETLDVAGNTSGFGDAFYAVVDVDGDGYTSTITEVVGTAGDEIFQTNIANLDSIKLDGGEGIDTLIINPASNSTLTLDSNKIANFEIYNLGTTATLKITDLASVKNAGSEYTDHALTIQGKTGSKVDLDTSAWSINSQTTVDGVTYNVYHYNGAIDTTSDLWIQNGVSVI